MPTDPIIVSLSSGQPTDAPEGRILPEHQSDAIPAEERRMIMERPYEEDVMRQSVRDQDAGSVAPPKKHR
ncbi:MAG: hypothetical protein ACOCVL_00415 [Candidatus Sumerlaeota bacterium]